MKIKIRYAVLTLTVFILSMCAGCALGQRLLTSPGTVEQIAPERTNFVSVVITNVQVTAASILPGKIITVTNDDGTLGRQVTPEQIIPAITNLTFTTNITPVIMPAVYFTNQVLSSGVTSAIHTADTAAGAAGIPWEHTAAEGLLAVGGLVLTFLNQRNKQRALDEANAHATTKGLLATAQLVGGTLVDNFEQLRKVALTIPAYTPELDHKVMNAVQTAQSLAGVKSEIHDLVEDRTGDTVNPIVPGA